MAHQHLNRKNSLSPIPTETTNGNGLKDHQTDEGRSVVGRPVMAAELVGSAAAATMSEEYHKRLIELRQQQLDEQVLIANLQHQQQLQEHFKRFLQKQQEEQQNAVKNHQLRILEEQRQERNDLVNAVLNKDKSRESANASSAVKQHLQKFVIGRRKGKFDNYTNDVIERSRLRWTPSLDSRNGIHDMSAPYPHSVLYDKRSSFPLRKTASEPNLKVRSRIRAKISGDRRCSPLLSRHSTDTRPDLVNRIKRKMNPQDQAAADNSACNSAPNSGPSSPSNSNSNINNSSASGSGSSIRGVGGLPTGAASETELPGYVYPLSMALHGRDLYASPSLPNISCLTSLSQKKSDGSAVITGAPPGLLMYPEADLQRLALARTSSLPGPLMQMYKFPGRLPDLEAVQSYTVQMQNALLNASAMSEKDSPPGPIRHTPLTRPHKALSRTHSAPTTTAQIQHHILQRKRNEQRQYVMQHQHKHAPHYVSGMAAEPYRPLATHREATEHTEPSKQRTKKLAASPPPTHPSAISSTTAAALVSHLRNNSKISKHFAAKHSEAKPGPLPSSTQTYMDHSPTVPQSDKPRSVIVAAPAVSRNHSSDQDDQDVVVVKQERPDASEPQGFSPGAAQRQLAAMAVKDKIASSHDHLPTKPSPLQARRSLLEGEMGQHRPLTRTQSSPAVSFSQKPPHKEYRYTTGLAYDPVMLRHGCACGDAHAEHAGRLKEVWARLNETGLTDDCESTEPRKATMEELQLAHTHDHTLRYGATPLARQQSVLESKFIVLPCGGVGVDNGIDIDTVWNELDTINAARMAVGLTVDLALSVAADELRNGFAVVRPPGHHAEKNLAMAFCYFNSVAVAARQLQRTYPDKIRRVLIVDWDVHHCNGTQDIFYDDPSVLVISIHRYDEGNFFPGTGAPDETGAGAGVGFNVNIGFSGGLDPPIGDADYLAAFRSVVMPIAEEFQPDFVFISAGFSAADGHPSALGGYKASPECFSYLTRLLSRLAGGKMVMALEGGFELGPLCDCVEICVRTLLSSPDAGDVSALHLPESSLNASPCDNSLRSINRISRIQERYWSRLKRMSAYANTTHAAFLRQEQEDRTCVALASLSVEHGGKHMSGKAKLREALMASRSAPSKIDKEPTRTPEKLEDDEDESKLTIVTDDVDEELSLLRPKDTYDEEMSAESSPLDVVGLSSGSDSASPSPAANTAFAAQDEEHESPRPSGVREPGRKLSSTKEEPMDEEEDPTSPAEGGS